MQTVMLSLLESSSTASTWQHSSVTSRPSLLTTIASHLDLILCQVETQLAGVRQLKLGANGLVQLAHVGRA